MRGWEFDDYIQALDSIGETPFIDEAFINAFCKAPQGNSGMPFKEFLESV